jgi:protein involved in ribonucleotide reduction
MLNEIMIGIAQKLNQVFGDDYHIHIDEIEQGLKEPCFLIVNLKGAQEQEIGTLYNRDQSFDIHYFPKNKKKIIREVNSVVDTLNMELEYITVVGNLVRGTEMKHEVVDGVLHFFVNYNIRIRKVVEPDPFMGIVQFNGGVKISDD